MTTYRSKLAPVTIHHGDCLPILATMPAASIDAIVTDPPYGLGFMGKAWDALPPGEEWARECLRVLKPGGHLLAFGGTRTWHRLAVAVEDAGFEIRDSIAWLYGSGFPKSLDVSKAIDKAAGAERPVVGVNPRAAQQTPKVDATSLGAFAGTSPDLTGPATPEAEQWSGWGTALKPAFEPIVVARKPLEGTVAANVLAYGTGAINVDGCRIEGGNRPLLQNAGRADPRSEGFHSKFGSSSAGTTDLGRWPANVVLDEDQAAELDQQSGVSTTPRTVTRDGDSGGASRFFYVAKAPKRERPVVDGVAHPTVKPLTLMRWLVRLVTPAGGVVLDPFAGSGTTIEAALLEGFQAVGVERETDYLPMIDQRIRRATA